MMMKRASSANSTHLSVALQRIVNELRENTLTELSLGQTAQYAVNYYTALRLQVYITSCTSLRRLNLHTRHVTTQALTVLLTSAAAANRALTIMPESSSSSTSLTTEGDLPSHYYPLLDARKGLIIPQLTINIVGGLNVMESKAVGAGLSSFHVVIPHNKQNAQRKQRFNGNNNNLEYELDTSCANSTSKRNANKTPYQHSSQVGDELSDRTKNHLHVFARPPRRNAISAPVRIADDNISASDAKGNYHIYVQRNNDKRCNSKEVQIANGGVMWRLSPVHTPRESHKIERPELNTPQLRSRCSSSHVPLASCQANVAKKRVTSMNDNITRYLERQHCKYADDNDYLNFHKDNSKSKRTKYGQENRNKNNGISSRKSHILATSEPMEQHEQQQQQQFSSKEQNENITMETKSKTPSLSCRVKLILELQQLSTVSAGYVLDGLRQGNQITSFHLQLHTLSQETRSAVRYIQCHINQILERNKKIMLHAEHIYVNQQAGKQRTKHDDVSQITTAITNFANENERQSYSEIFLREREATRTKKPSDCIITQGEIHKQKNNIKTIKNINVNTHDRNVFALPHTPVTSPRCVASRNAHRTTEHHQQQQQHEHLNEKRQEEQNIQIKRRYGQNEIQNSACSALRPHTPSPRLMKHENATYMRRPSIITQSEHNIDNHCKDYKNSEYVQSEKNTQNEQNNVSNSHLANHWHHLHAKEQYEENKENNESTPSPSPRRPPPPSPPSSLSSSFSREQLKYVDNCLCRDENFIDDNEKFRRNHVECTSVHKKEENDTEHLAQLPLLPEIEKDKVNNKNAEVRSESVHKTPITPREERQCQLESTSSVAHTHRYCRPHQHFNNHNDDNCLQVCDRHANEMSTLSCSSSTSESSIASLATSTSMTSAISLESEITQKSILSSSPSTPAAAIAVAKMRESNNNDNGTFITGLCIDAKHHSQQIEEEELLTATPPSALPVAPPPSPKITQSSMTNLFSCASYGAHKEEPHEEEQWELHENTTRNCRELYRRKYVGVSEASTRNGITPVNEQNLCSQSPVSGFVSPRIHGFHSADNAQLPSPEIRAIWPNGNNVNDDDDDNNDNYRQEHTIPERTSARHAQCKFVHANPNHKDNKIKTDKETKKSSTHFAHTICTTPPRSMRTENKCKHVNVNKEDKVKHKQMKQSKSNHNKKINSESMDQEVEDKNSKQTLILEESEEEREQNQEEECMPSSLNSLQEFSLANVTISASPSPSPPQIREHVDKQEMPIKSLATASEIVKRADNNQTGIDNTNESQCKANNLEQDKKNCNVTENDHNNVEYIVTQNAIKYIYERGSDINNVLSEYQVNAAEQIQRVVEYVESWNSNLSYTVTLQLSEIMMVLADIQRSAHTSK